MIAFNENLAAKILWFSFSIRVRHEVGRELASFSNVQMWTSLKLNFFQFEKNKQSTNIIFFTKS